MKVEIDNEVYDFLQKQAIPFEETTPNAVLRRFLLEGKKMRQVPEKNIQNSIKKDLYRFIKTVDKFVDSILQTEFQETFTRKGRFQFMFESDNYLVYFQNFNKENNKLWYRINAKPLETLRMTQKTAFLCFTNPAMKIAYLIPLRDVEERIVSTSWQRNYLEVNIDHISSRWIELDWTIKEYLKEYK